MLMDFFYSSGHPIHDRISNRHITLNRLSRDYAAFAQEKCMGTGCQNISKTGIPLPEKREIIRLLLLPQGLKSRLPRR